MIIIGLSTIPFVRELIPAMTKGFFSRNNKDELGESEFWALKDVSFEVKKGEALGIICPNGAGKSTILKLFSGILKPNKGNISVNGRLSNFLPNYYKLRTSLFDIKTGKVFYSYQQNDNMVISMPENDILSTKEYAVFDVPSFWQLIE